MFFVVLAKVNLDMDSHNISSLEMLYDKKSDKLSRL